MEEKYELLGIELPFEEFDRLMCEQNKGKELIVENGTVVAREHIFTQEEINEQRKVEIKERLLQLNEDAIQVQMGEIVPDWEKKQAEFISLHNELRVLEGKQPRKIKIK